jgi:hypothetical protein
MPQDGTDVGISILICDNNGDGDVVDLPARLAAVGVPPPSVLCIHGGIFPSSSILLGYQYHGLAGNVAVYTQTTDGLSVQYSCTLDTALLEIVKTDERCLAADAKHRTVVRIVIKDRMTLRDTAAALRLYGKPHVVVAEGPSGAFQATGVTRRWLRGWASRDTPSNRCIKTAEQAVRVTHVEKVLSFPACRLIVMECTPL